MVRGRVAVELAVPNAVISAFDIVEMNWRPRRLTTNRIAIRTKKCAVRPMMTVSMYLPTPRISRQKCSPPPLSPSLDEIRAKIPIGAKYMIHTTIFIITSFIPSKKATRGFPRSPTVVRAAANRMENTITSSSLVSAAEAMMLSPISERIISTKPVSSLPLTRSGTTWLTSVMPAPG